MRFAMVARPLTRVWSPTTLPTSAWERSSVTRGRACACDTCGTTRDSPTFSRTRTGDASHRTRPAARNCACCSNAATRRRFELPGRSPSRSSRLTQRPTTEEADVAESAPTHTLDDVQWLATRTRDGKILSCYVDMSFTGGVRPLWREHLKENVRRLEQLMASDKDALDVFERSMAHVETTLSNPGLANHGGIAVFARPESVHAFSLTSPVANRLVFDEEPYLVPLLEHLHRQRHYLVVHT